MERIVYWRLIQLETFQPAIFFQCNFSQQPKAYHYGHFFLPRAPWYTTENVNVLEKTRNREKREAASIISQETSILASKLLCMLRDFPHVDRLRCNCYFIFRNNRLIESAIVKKTLSVMNLCLFAII